MKKNLYSEEQIIVILKQHEAYIAICSSGIRAPAGNRNSAG